MCYEPEPSLTLTLLFSGKKTYQLQIQDNFYEDYGGSSDSENSSDDELDNFDAEEVKSLSKQLSHSNRLKKGRVPRRSSEGNERTGDALRIRKIQTKSKKKTAEMSHFGSKKVGNFDKSAFELDPEVKRKVNALTKDKRKELLEELKKWEWKGDGEGKDGKGSGEYRIEERKLSS